MVYNTHQVSVINNTQYIGCFLSHNNFVNLSSNVFVFQNHYLIFDPESNFTSVTSITSISKAHDKYKNPFPLKNNKIINNSSSNLTSSLVTKKVPAKRQNPIIKNTNSNTNQTKAIRPITRISNQIIQIPTNQNEKTITVKQVKNQNVKVNNDDDEDDDEDDENAEDEEDEEDEEDNEINKELNLLPSSKKKLQMEIFKIVHKIKRIDEATKKLKEQLGKTKNKFHKLKLQNVINSLNIRTYKLKKFLVKVKRQNNKLKFILNTH